MENLIKYELVKGNTSKEWIFEAQDITLDDNWEGRLVVKKNLEDDEKIVDKALDLDKENNRFIAYLNPDESDIDVGEYILTIELKNEQMEPKYKKEVYQIILKIIPAGI